MTVAYWILAVLLSTLYVYAGGKKVTQTKDQLRPMMKWVDDLPMSLVRTIGALELLGVAGLVLPPLTGVAPRLALAAAVGFELLQVGAVGMHMIRGEVQDIWLNVTLLVLGVITIWLATVWT